MPKIDTSSWGKFTVSDVCCVLKGRKKLSNVNITDLGSTPVYSSTTENNGITGYTEESPDYVIDTDTPFYIIFGDHTKSMYISTNDFCVMDNVKVLVPKVYNKYAMQFVLASWQKSIPTLGYSRHWSVAKKAIFKLPTDSKGNPDWLYMENYMRNIEVRVSTSLSKLESAQRVENSKIDVSNWLPFHLYDIFHITMGNKFDKGKMNEINPKVDFVGRSGVNNGVTCCVDYVYDEKGNLVQPYKAGDITIAMGGSIGSSFIQKNDFYTSQNVCVLHTDNPDITYLVKQFIITSIYRSCANYEAFVNELNRHIKTDFVIYLPIDSRGEPDWLYMENYMKALETRVNDFLDKTT